MSLEIKVPTVGESITEVTIAAWLKKTGDYVNLDDLICELESDKATFEIRSEANGILNINTQEGQTIAIGTVIATLDTDATASEQKITDDKSEKEIKSEDVKQEDKKESYANGHASPAAHKILSEKGINSESVKGSGIGGRITKEDAIKAKSDSLTTEKIKSNKPDSNLASFESNLMNHQSQDERSMRKERMSSLRKTISKRLVAVKNETAMLTTFNEVDMSEVMNIRKKYKDVFKEKYDINLGFISFFTKAVCIALEEFPAVNAQIHDNEIIYHNFCDISIAVSTSKGLVVPVIRNAEKMSFQEIEKEVVRLAVKARDGKLSIDDMSGGTFTITNGGVFGSMLSTPIINAPQSGILGMHNIVERPVALNGEVVIRPIMYIALSYDHRIIDGKDSVGFLVRVKQLLEDPTRLLLKV